MAIFNFAFDSSISNSSNGAIREDYLEQGLKAQGTLLEVNSSLVPLIAAAWAVHGVKIDLDSASFAGGQATYMIVGHLPVRLDSQMEDFAPSVKRESAALSSHANERDSLPFGDVTSASPHIIAGQMIGHRWHTRLSDGELIAIPDIVRTDGVEREFNFSLMFGKKQDRMDTYDHILASVQEGYKLTGAEPGQHIMLHYVAFPTGMQMKHISARDVLSLTTQNFVFGYSLPRGSSSNGYVSGIVHKTSATSSSTKYKSAILQHLQSMQAAETFSVPAPAPAPAPDFRAEAGQALTKMDPYEKYAALLLLGVFSSRTKKRDEDFKSIVTSGKGLMEMLTEREVKFFRGMWLSEYSEEAIAQVRTMGLELRAELQPKAQKKEQPTASTKSSEEVKEVTSTSFNFGASAPAPKAASAPKSSEEVKEVTNTSFSFGKSKPAETSRSSKPAEVSRSSKTTGVSAPVFDFSALAEFEIDSDDSESLVTE